MEQRKIIDNLNHYLNWRGLPVELNENGVCHGLASVYCKYILENKENKFYKLLQYGADKQPEPGQESEINDFIQSIVLSFNPEVFDTSLSQLDSLKTLTVKNKPLIPALQLGGVNSDSKWIKVLTEIAPQDQEAMLISSPSHTVALRKDENGYHLYDPNIGQPPYPLENEAELLDALKESFNFSPEERMLPLMMQVVRHPEAKPRDLPAASMIYSNYFKETKNDSVQYRGREFTTLKLAARFNDKDAMEILSGMGASEKNAAQIAVIYNNPDSLDSLLKEGGDDEYKELLGFAIRTGRKEAFELLAHKQPEIFNSYVEQAHEIPLIHDAAQGGNEFILAEIISRSTTEKTKDQVVQQLFKKDVLETDAMMCAILGGSTSCVRHLLEKIKDHEPFREMAQVYIQTALERKKPLVLAYLLNELPKECLTPISLSDEDAGKTNICMLKTLSKHQLLNSPKAEEILASAKASMVNSEAVDKYAQKTKTGFKLQDLVEFLSENPFTQFLKEKFEITKKTFNSFKEQLGRIKTSTYQQEALDEETVQNTTASSFN